MKEKADGLLEFIDPNTTFWEEFALVLVVIGLLALGYLMWGQDQDVTWIDDEENKTE